MGRLCTFRSPPQFTIEHHAQSLPYAGNFSTCSNREEPVVRISILRCRTLERSEAPARDGREALRLCVREEARLGLGDLGGPFLSVFRELIAFPRPTCARNDHSISTGISVIAQ
jgi:hypothetical protein